MPIINGLTLLHGKSNTECLGKNSGDLVIHIYGLLNHRVGTFRKFSAKTAQVLVTRILERWQHYTVSSRYGMKVGVIQSWHLTGKGAVHVVVCIIKVCDDCSEKIQRV
jgi:hypothetical protein